MITALGYIADHQTNPTEQTVQKFKQLLDNAASHPYAVLTYQSSEMVLAGHSDASYLFKTNDCNQEGGNFVMSNNTTFPPNNGTVLKVSK